MTRVHHVLASLNEEVGGPAWNVSRLHEESLRCGLESTLHSLNYERHGPLLAGKEKDFPRAGWFTRISRGWNSTFNRRLSEALREQPGLVHNHGCWMATNWTARRMALQYRVPMMISPRGMLESWSLHHHPLRKSLAWRLYEKKNLESATCFHATCAAEAESIADLGFRQPIYFVPNGVDLPEDLDILTAPDWASWGPAPFVLFLSRLHRKKGLDLLLGSWRKLKQRFDGWHLVIAGPDMDDYRTELKKSHSWSFEDNSIHWRDSVRGDEKSWLLSRASFLALPSHSENFGQVVAEAMAHSTPVLTTDRTPWIELPRRGCGWVVPPRMEALTEALETAMETPPSTLRQMGEQACAWMRRDFSWNRITIEMRRAYEHQLGTGVEPEFVIRP